MADGFGRDEAGQFAPVDGPDFDPGALLPPDPGAAPDAAEPDFATDEDQPRVPEGEDAPDASADQPDQADTPDEGPTAARLAALEQERDQLRAYQADQEARQFHAQRQAVAQQEQRAYAHRQKLYETARDEGTPESLDAYRGFSDQITQYEQMKSRAAQQQAQQADWGQTMSAWSVHLAQQHGLTEAERQEIWAFQDPNAMELHATRLGELKQFKDGRTTASDQKARGDQQRRMRGAQVGGGTGGGVAPQPYDPGSAKHLDAIFSKLGLSGG